MLRAWHDGLQYNSSAPMSAVTSGRRLVAQRAVRPAAAL